MRFILSVTYQEIETFLKDAGYRYSPTSEEGILTGFGEMEFYRDIDRQPRLGILITLEEGGGYLRVMCPRLYVCQDNKYQMDLFKSCLIINYWAKLARFEYDDRDGELRVSIEIPLEDASLTQAQLSRCLTSLAYLIDHIDPMIRKTLKQGGIHIPRQKMNYF